MKRFITYSLIPVTAVACIAGAAWAGPNKGAGLSDSEEIQAALSSGMNISQAIDTAQTSTGGTAIAAEWEDTADGSWGYEVEVANADGVMQTWFVNANDSSVTQVEKSRHDRDHRGDHKGRKGDRDHDRGQNGDQDQDDSDADDN